MKNLLPLIALLLFIAPSSADDSAVPVFSDKDLERYKSPDNYTTESRPAKEEKRKKEQWKAARYEVAYMPAAGGGKKIIIPVTINNSLTAHMLLDTGSTGMYISSELAERLGVYKKDEGNLSVSVMGAGGKFPAIITVVDTVQVGEAKDDFVPTMVEVRKTNGDSTPGKSPGTVFEGFEGVIGMDFMSKYSMQIDTDRQVVVFVENPPSADMPGGHDELWWRSTFHMFASLRSDWKKYRDSLRSVPEKDETVIMRELRLWAERQCEEAGKLMIKLNNYAIDHVVPMEWREY